MELQSKMENSGRTCKSLTTGKLMLSSLVPRPPHPVFVACSTASARTGGGFLGRKAIMLVVLPVCNLL